MSLKKQATSIIQTHIKDAQVINVTGVGGGCINETFKCETTKGTFFVKVNHKSFSKTMFEAEFKGLTSLKETNTIYVPTPLKYGELPNSNGGFLILEYCNMRRLSYQDQRKLGQQLAALHLDNIKSGKIKQFGYFIDNFIGSTKQINTWTDSWSEFYKKYRLGYQIELCKSSYNDVYNKGKQLMDVVDTFFEGLDIKPSLIHGDLWGGNASSIPGIGPVIYDPAVYYGHHEAELGIMQMFGGFSDDCFDEYWKAMGGKQKGFEERVQLYELYHYLNHLNLFGGGYKSSCLEIMRSLL